MVAGRGRQNVDISRTKSAAPVRGKGNVDPVAAVGGIEIVKAVECVGIELARRVAISQQRAADHSGIPVEARTQNVVRAHKVDLKRRQMRREGIGRGMVRVERDDVDSPEPHGISRQVDEILAADRQPRQLRDRRRPRMDEKGGESCEAEAESGDLENGVRLHCASFSKCEPGIPILPCLVTAFMEFSPPVQHERRRRCQKTSTPSPPMIIAQVLGSGTTSTSISVPPSARNR